MVTPEKNGLEGRFNGVNVGDLLILKRTIDGHEDLVGGFVSSISKDRVTLSHENPDNNGGYFLFQGDRTYKLESFEDYRVINPTKP